MNLDVLCYKQRGTYEYRQNQNHQQHSWILSQATRRVLILLSFLRGYKRKEKTFYQLYEEFLEMLEM